MSEILRPDSNVTQSGFTGGFAEIDETPASDTDKAYGANNTAAVLEVGISNPSGTPGSGTITFRYRHVKTNNGTVDGGGNAVTVTAEVVEGTTVRATDAAQTATGTVAQREWSPDLSAVSNWNDLRFRFTTSASGGSPANRRGAAVTWAEMEVPDPAASNPTTLTVENATINVSEQALNVNAQTKRVVDAANIDASEQLIILNAQTVASVEPANINIAGQAVSLGGATTLAVGAATILVSAVDVAIRLTTRVLITAASLLVSPLSVMINRGVRLVGSGQLVFQGVYVQVRNAGAYVACAWQRLTVCLGIGL